MIGAIITAIILIILGGVLISSGASTDTIATWPLILGGVVAVGIGVVLIWKAIT